MHADPTDNVETVASGDRTLLPEGIRTVPIFIMGKKYLVPETLTVQKAIEYAGYQLIRACGCRGGICGACATVWRVIGDFQIHFGLACQTVIEANMVLAQLPFFPANRATYDVEELEASCEAIASLYPEVMKCVGCNTCTRACPMDIDVMGYINAAMRGDVARVAHTSFECIQCGLCAARCPAQIAHYHVAQLCRRLYGRYVQAPSEHLKDSVEQIASGRHDESFEGLVQMDDAALRRLYVERESEPQEATDWEPNDKTYL